MRETPSLDSMQSPDTESKAYWTIFMVGFAVLFVLVLLGTLFGIHWRNYLPGAEDAKSMSQGVKSAVYTFMSHII
jgi:light-harvesting complex 1 beta chain